MEKAKAEAADKRAIVEAFINESAPPYHSDHTDIIDWLVRRSRSLRRLADDLNPKESA